MAVAQQAGPLISVVVPVFNAGSYLETMAGSVLGQTHRNLELILVDDRSTDDSYAIMHDLQAQDGRVRVLQMPSNSGGPARPRNHGVDNAKAEFVAFCDSDDIWLPQKLERQLAVLSESDATMTCTQAQRFHDEAQIRSLERAGRPRTSSISFGGNRIKNQVVSSSVLIWRKHLLRHRFNEAADYRAVEDYDCWLRILEKDGCAIKIEEPLVAYRISEGQISSGKLRHLRKVFRVHWNYPRNWAKPAAPFFTVTHASFGLAQRLLGLSI